MSGPGVPGPGILVILFGLSFLALEFDRAERILEKAIVWADNAAQRAENATPRQKAITGVLGVLALGAFAAWAILYDIPLVPVLDGVGWRHGYLRDSQARRMGRRRGARAAAARSTEEGDKDDSGVRWIRSYVLAEGDGRVGTVCIDEADSPETIQRHADAAELPVDEIIPVADTVIVRPDPEPAQA